VVEVAVVVVVVAVGSNRSEAHSNVTPSLQQNMLQSIDLLTAV
jgi:hypothetical protein